MTHDDNPPCAMWLGWTLLEIDSAKQLIRARFRPKPDMLNPHGTVQGGMVAAMLDEAMGAALFYLGGKVLRASTVSLTVSCLRPALPGELCAQAEAEDSVPRIRACGSRGAGLATASATAVPVMAS